MNAETNNPAWEAAQGPGRATRALPSIRQRRVRAALGAAWLSLALLMPWAQAETVALWLFDEPAGAETGAQLKDEVGGNLTLALDRAAAIQPGKFGGALWPAAQSWARVENGQGGSDPRAAQRGPKEEAARRDPTPMSGGAATLTATAPVLGAHDWTVECWLRLNHTAGGEGVIFEFAAEGVAANPLVIRFTVRPEENAFALTAPSARGDGNVAVGAKRVEYSSADGPSAGVALLQSTTLALEGAPLARDQWLHVALVHAAAAESVRLFVDGRFRAVATVALAPLPPAEHVHLIVGSDRSGACLLDGGLDELRISNHAVYSVDFTPPGSFSKQRKRLAP